MWLRIKCSTSRLIEMTSLVTFVYAAVFTFNCCNGWDKHFHYNINYSSFAQVFVREHINTPLCRPWGPLIWDQCDTSDTVTLCLLNSFHAAPEERLVNKTIRTACNSTTSPLGDSAPPPLSDTHTHTYTAKNTNKSLLRMKIWTQNVEDSILFNKHRFLLMWQRVAGCRTS